MRLFFDLIAPRKRAPGSSTDSLRAVLGSASEFLPPDDFVLIESASSEGLPRSSTDSSADTSASGEGLKDTAPTSKKEHLPAEILLRILLGLSKTTPPKDLIPILIATAGVCREWRGVTKDVIRATPALSASKRIANVLLMDQIQTLILTNEKDPSFPPDSNRYLFSLIHAPTPSFTYPGLEPAKFPIIGKIAFLLKSKLIIRKGQEIDTGDLFDLTLFIARTSPGYLSKLEALVADPLFQCQLSFLQAIITEWRTFSSSPRTVAGFIVTCLSDCLNAPENQTDTRPKEVRSILEGKVQATIAPPPSPPSRAIIPSSPDNFPAGILTPA